MTTTHCQARSAGNDGRSADGLEIKYGFYDSGRRENNFLVYNMVVKRVSFNDPLQGWHILEMSETLDIERSGRNTINKVL